MAGLFLLADLRRITARRDSLDSELPIELKAAMIWVAEVTVENLSAPLAQ